MIAQFTNAAVEPLWRGLDLKVHPGEFLTVLGPNGVGKSTLLNAIIGARKLTSGTVRATERVGLIPQQRMFAPELPVRAGDLVSLALAHGVVRRRRAPRREVDRLLDKVGAGHLRRRRVGTLSGGQQQLVRQAQAFARDPELLLADEPLLSLDPKAQAHTVELFAQHCRAGGAVICVTHDVNPFLKVTDRILYLGPESHVLGGVEEVLDPDVLSRLYRTRVDVVRVGDRVVV